MRAYLSIDLDYWRDHGRPHNVRAFFQRVWALKLPIRVALHHHHLIDDINRRAKHLDTVINVDYHSDIVEDVGADFILDEGTWANYVKFQSRGTFIWRYPHQDCLNDQTGYCHTYLNPFEEHCTEWRRVKKEQGLGGLSWQDIKAVGVCLSPPWLNRPWVVHYPMEVLNLFDWFGRWSAIFNCSAGCMVDKFKESENGTGIFKPRLTRPKKCAMIE